MKFYGYDREKTLGLKIKWFWYLNRQIDRLRAEDDIRHLRLLASVGSEEAYKQTYDGLNTSLGQISVIDEERRSINLDENGQDPAFDRTGLQKLRQKFAQVRK